MEKNNLFSEDDMTKSIVNLINIKLNTIISNVKNFKDTFDETSDLDTYEKIINYKTSNLKFQNNFDYFIKDHAIKSKQIIEELLEQNKDIILDIESQIVKSNNILFNELLNSIGLNTNKDKVVKISKPEVVVQLEFDF